MKSSRTIQLIALVCIHLLPASLTAQNKVPYDEIHPLASYNFVLGTNSIGGNYHFSSEPNIVEQARHVRAMGSNMLKISLGKNSPKTYGLSQTGNPSTTLDLFTLHPEYKMVFDMDFKYVFIWVHTLTGIDWKNGISTEEEKTLYKEIFDFASYLLQHYDNSGKTFLIGNWEGDWLLHPNRDRKATPSKDHIAYMTHWFQIRQRAIDDAKRNMKSNNVFLYHYIEVNLVLKGMQGAACIASEILPSVDVDLVSYSSYEAIKNKPYEEKKATLAAVMSYLENQLKPKESLPFSRRVFIGEYGYHANASKPESFVKQYNESKDVMKISFALNLPFALYWQMYNNEYDNSGNSRQMGLINEAGIKTPLYYLHQKLYNTMNDYLMEYKSKNNSYPTQDEFNNQALKTLDLL